MLSPYKRYHIVSPIVIMSWEVIDVDNVSTIVSVYIDSKVVEEFGYDLFKYWVWIDWWIFTIYESVYRDGPKDSVVGIDDGIAAILILKNM